MFRQSGFGNALVIILVAVSLVAFGYFFVGRIVRYPSQNVAGAHTEASLFSFLRNLFRPQSIIPSNSTSFPTPLLFTPNPIIGNDHYAIHSFIFLGYSTASKTYLFDGAVRTGKKLIRLGMSVNEVEPQQGSFQWPKADENVKMALDRNLIPVMTLGYSAPWLSAPTALRPYQGPIDPNKYDQYTSYIKAVVSHYPQITYWEIWNEPDAKGLYDSNPAEFAKILKISYQAVKQANPNAQVLFPGAIAGNTEWTKNVLTDSSNPGKNNYDIANFHSRTGTIKQLKSRAAQEVNTFNQYGKANALIWVTEHGYPADFNYQLDPNYKGTDLSSGEEAQANFYKESLPMLTGLGIDKVFVTLRDETQNGDACGRKLGNSPFCSEGLMTFPYTYSTSGRDRPSMATFQSL